MSKVIKNQTVYDRKLQIINCMEGKTTVQICKITGLTAYIIKNMVKLMRIKGIKFKNSRGKNRSHKWSLLTSKQKIYDILKSELIEIEVCSKCGATNNFHFSHGIKTDICRSCYKASRGLKSEREPSQYKDKLQHNGAPWFIITSDLQGMYLRIEEQRLPKKYEVGADGFTRERIEDQRDGEIRKRAEAVS
jgi:ribosomal protein L40E